ncbi:MAG: hypothetical protein Fur0037_23570 [Planctomycetota bacterium]
MSPWPLALALLLAGCGEPSSAGGREPTRQGRFGSLRDFVLFERAPEEGGPFFLDRFEVTRSDWEEFEGRATGGESSDLNGALPMVGIDLHAARRFAAWRFARLPRLDEWTFAATGGGKDRYPWGSVWRSTCANCRDLGLAEPTPVGTFESGRKPSGPYDLVGNAAEWTETVPQDLLRLPERSPPERIEDLNLMHWLVERSFGLAFWVRPWRPSPTLWLVAAVDERMPRLVVGGSYLTTMGQNPPPAEQLQVARLPADLDPGTGLRLAADPVSILRALGRYERPLSVEEDALLRGFLRRPGHREALAAALATLGDAPGGEDRPVLSVLRSELGR